MSSPSGPLLQVRGLQKRYRRLLGPARVVLAGLDLELEQGQALGLLGPNGSGKSTLLRLVAGLERPDAGHVRVRGHAPDERATRRRIGLLADDFPFPPELSAVAVLELSAALYGLRRRERRQQASHWLERVGLGAHRRDALGHFSLGMKRRFALAAAFLHQPELLLLDEPTAGLDAEGYLVLEELLAEARVRAVGVLLATHVPGDLEGHAQECAVLFSGRLVRRLAVAELLGGRAPLVALYRELARTERSGAACDPA